MIYHAIFFILLTSKKIQNVNYTVKNASIEIQ